MYEYMKEYVCNGVRPDLKDSVLIEAFYDGRWHPQTQISNIYWTTEECEAYVVEKIRIVDPSYKPKAEADWFERGDNPPLGEVVKIKVWDTRAGWVLQEHAYRVDYIGESFVIATSFNTPREVERCFQSVKFEPVDNEHTELVKSLGTLINNCSEDIYYALSTKQVEALAEHIVNENWRPKENKDE